MAIIPSCCLALPKIRVACVGDSITEGSDSASYPAFLQEYLGNRFNVRNFGAGSTAALRRADKPYWVYPAYQAAKDFNPHIVIINFGLNDSKPQNWAYGANFRRDYLALVNQFRKLPSKPRVFIAIPTPLLLEERFGLTKSVVENEISPIIRKLSLTERLPLIDLYSALVGYPELQPDYIHPNAEGMAIIARTVAAKIISLRRFK